MYWQAVVYIAWGFDVDDRAIIIIMLTSCTGMSVSNVRSKYSGSIKPIQNNVGKKTWHIVIGKLCWESPIRGGELERI